MTNAITALLAVAVLLWGVGTFTQTIVSQTNRSVAAWQQSEQSMLARRDTDIKVDWVNATSSSATSSISVLIDNTGTQSLSQFSSWDFIFRYFDQSNQLHVAYVTYTDSSTLANNQWNMQGIYQNEATGTREVIQPGIFDPGEQMLVDVQLSTSISTNKVNAVAIATTSGMTTLTAF